VASAADIEIGTRLRPPRGDLRHPIGSRIAFVNLYSDTQTQPTAAMRAAIAAAEVGDEQLRQDPTTLALEERVAELLGHEAAVFLPSGTMCNEIAIRLHIRPGGEQLFLGRDTHPLTAEAGGPAELSGAVITEVDGKAGMFGPAALEAAIVGSGPGGRYGARPRLVCVEQTTNLGGGRVWPLAAVAEVLAVARGHELAAHLDGARLMNAVVASGLDAATWAAPFDSAWLDFTKGLGAPVGACLAGSVDFIEEAWRWKQMLGGALRQSGIVAAGALHALDHHVERLAGDHARARRLAEGLAELPGIELDPTTVETNIVMFTVPDAAGFCAALAADDVAMSQFGPRRVRAVTHLDVDDAGIERALGVAARALG
jgi:threonine aldolase